MMVLDDRARTHNREDGAMTIEAKAAADRAFDVAAGKQTPYTGRARYFDSGNAFNMVYPDVPAAAFVAERNAALDPATGTRLILCDQSAAMEIAFPATSPLVLASYARVRGGESLTFDPRASVVLAYVIEGSGRAVQGPDAIAWSTGDVFSLPGGRPVELISPVHDSVLWLVTNEPELAFERLAPPPAGEALVEAAHFPAATITEELGRARAKLAGQRVAGLAVVFASEQLADRRNISPSLTLAMNQLGAGEQQAPHSHNAVAVSLAINCARCYSMVDGTRKDWEAFVTMVTPPASVHSHHNAGTAPANWLIVQDGGFHYHARTMGFRFEEVVEHR
jgi:gentisate 1,2-dioxygenase